jgi:hypothetical protein
MNLLSVIVHSESEVMGRIERIQTTITRCRTLLTAVALGHLYAWTRDPCYAPRTWGFGAVGARLLTDDSVPGVVELEFDPRSALRALDRTVSRGSARSRLV